SEEHTSELQSLTNLVCRLLLEKKKKQNNRPPNNLHEVIPNYEQRDGDDASTDNSTNAKNRNQNCSRWRRRTDVHTARVDTRVYCSPPHTYTCSALCSYVTILDARSVYSVSIIYPAIYLAFFTFSFLFFLLTFPFSHPFFFFFLNNPPPPEFSPFPQPAPFPF